MSGGGTTPRKGLALALLCSVQFMVVLDNAIGNVALPSIRQDLGFSQSDLQYVISLYALTFGGFLILGGRLGDIYGRRRLFIIGTAIFGAASLVCGLAESSGVLLAARAAQGLGGALVTPTALALISTTFTEGPERNRALGLWGAVAASGAAAGMILGGVLTDAFGWEWCFFVNVPIAAGAVAVSRPILPESKGADDRHLDFAGAVLVTAGLGLLVYGVTRGQGEGFGSSIAIALLSASVVALVSFAITERLVRNPLVPFRIFRVGDVLGADTGSVLLAAVISGQSFFLTIFMQQILGYSPIETGLSFLPISLAAFLGSAIAAKLAGRGRPLMVMSMGLLLLAASMAWLTRIGPDTTFLGTLLPGFIVSGIGLGMGFVSATIAATGGVPAEEQGLASGLLSSAQQVGFAVGVAALVSVAASGSEAAAGPEVERTLAGFHTGLWAAAGIALAAAALTAALAARGRAAGGVPGPASGTIGP